MFSCNIFSNLGNIYLSIDLMITLLSLFLMNSIQVCPQVANIERGEITFIALNSDSSMLGLIVNFKICPGCRDVLTRLAFEPQSKMYIVHVNFQVVSNSCFVVALVTLVLDLLVDLPDVSL